VSRAERCSWCESQRETLPHHCRVIDRSLTGTEVEATSLPVNAGERIHWMREEIGVVSANGVRIQEGGVAVEFSEMTPVTHDRLITALYTSGRTNAAGVVNRLEVLQGIVRRLLPGSS
jgi:hypothetical protein